MRPFLMQAEGGLPPGTARRPEMGPKIARWRAPATRPRARLDTGAYAARMTSVLTAVRDLGPLREITLVLTRHGFGEVLGRMGLGALLPGPAFVETETERRKMAWPE